MQFPATHLWTWPAGLGLTFTDPRRSRTFAKAAGRGTNSSLAALLKQTKKTRDTQDRFRWKKILTPLYQIHPHCLTKVLPLNEKNSDLVSVLCSSYFLSFTTNLPERIVLTTMYRSFHQTSAGQLLVPIKLILSCVYYLHITKSNGHSLDLVAPDLASMFVTCSLPF